MTSKRRENINLVSFICLSFLVISFSKQLLIIFCMYLFDLDSILVQNTHRKELSKYPAMLT